MSADGHSVCPKCHPEDRDKVGIWQNFTGGGGGDVREYYETYWQQRQINPTEPALGLFLVHDYGASCRTCDWSFSHKNETRIPV